MQYLGPIYNKLYLFGRKTLIQLKGFIYYGNTHQNKVLQGINSHTSFFSKDCKILKSFDKTAFENWIFISKSLKGLLPPVFNSWFKFSFESHSHDTRWLHLGDLKIPSYRTKTLAKKTVFLNAIYVQNHLQSCHQNVIFHQLITNKLKEILINFSLSKYN